MFPLGSTQPIVLRDGGLSLFRLKLIITVARHKWLENDVAYAREPDAVDALKPAVCLIYALPLSSTITDGHSCGDVECPFCFYPTFLPITDPSHDGAWAILATLLMVVSDQNRQSDTHNWYTRCIGDGHYG